MEDDKKQMDFFKSKSKPSKKKVMSQADRDLITMYNNNPTVVIGRAPKSTQKGHSDTPLFKPKNQSELF